MESFWNKTYPSSYSSDICAFLNSKFSDINFYPEKTERHFSSVSVFQKPYREERIFLDGEIDESFFFTFIVPFGGEDIKMTNGSFWLLERCLDLCEKAENFSFGRENISLRYFCRTKNPSKYDRTTTGEDWYSAEIKMCISRKG